MGTRHLIAVYLDGDYRVAQYGQWDGYPDGQGIACLKFARRLADRNFRQIFADKVRMCRWISKQEIKKIDERISSGELKHWQNTYPELSRDTSAEIFDLILNSNGLKLADNLDFAADSLFCEWAWVIDMDAKNFEAFRGFNKRKLTEEDRFFGVTRAEDCGEYYGVTLVTKWPLEDLPTDNEFLAAFATDDEV